MVILRRKGLSENGNLLLPAYVASVNAGVGRERSRLMKGIECIASVHFQEVRILVLRHRILRHVNHQLVKDYTP